MALLKDLIVQGPSRFIGNVYGPNFIVNGATSSQFLKGDGSLDSSVYLTQTTLNSGNPDLAAIEALTGTSGFLKKTAANAWTLDSNTYLTTSSASSTYLTQGNANTTYLKKTDASSTYLTQTDASSTYLTKTNASSTYLTQTSASNTYLTQTSANNTYLKKTDASSTYLTQTNASSTYLTKNNASSLYLTQANASNTYAPKASPALTGTPTAPTATTGTNTTQLATTAFVQQELSGITTDIEDNEKVIAAALTDLEDRKANTDDYLPLDGSNAMVGTIRRVYSSASNSPMLSLTSNNQDVWLWRIKDYATGFETDTSKVYGFGLKYLGTGSGNNNDLALYSDNQSGTQVLAMNIKQDGNIIFSKNITAASLIKSGGTSSQFLKADGSVDSTAYAPKASPALTGTPTAPTATTKTDNTQLATTAFVQQEINRGSKIIPLQENSSTTAGIWLAKTNEITSLADGQLFYYKIAVAGASTTTLNITNSAGTALGAKTIYIIGTSKLTTHYSVGHYLILAYNSLNDCFRVVNYYNSDTTLSYGYRDYYYRPVAGQTIYRYKLIAQGKDNRMYPIVITDQTSSTQVAKTPTSVGLRPFNIWYHSSTTTISPGNALSGQCIYSAMYLGDTCEYNFNTTIQTYQQVYLRGTYNSVEDLFYLYNDETSATTSYYTCVPINTANITLSNYFVQGYYYWLVGGSYNTANYMSLFDNNPLYYFDGTNLIPVTTAINNRWYGTEYEFDALTNLDDNTDYYIYDE